MLLAFFKPLYSSFYGPDRIAEAPIDKAWWDGLSEEWKTIFRINQQFSKQGVSIFKLQHEYVNRLNAAGEADYSPLNKSLYDLEEANNFGLGYTDLYARALRRKHMVHNDTIELATLADLDIIYMVNGPGDLTPLKKFPHLKVLILNYCGIGYNVPITKQLLDLEPLRDLKELEVLHCVSSALHSLEPIRGLANLQELVCHNTSITTLEPLKKLVNLKKLSVGSRITNAAVIARLENLEELYIKGVKQLPDLSGLHKLKRLRIAESEMAIVSSNYRINNLNFLKALPQLEYLDLNTIFYRGDLNALTGLQQLKAITLPSVSRDNMLAFKAAHTGCVIINAYEFER
jgi:hypothetical protein